MANHNKWKIHEEPHYMWPCDQVQENACDEVVIGCNVIIWLVEEWSGLTMARILKADPRAVKWSKTSEFHFMLNKFYKYQAELLRIN